MKREPIKMPVLSDTMETGHFIGWKKQIGEAVKKGDVLAEIESDKAIMDLEAFEDGYLAGPLAKPDSEIATGTVIGYLVDSKEAASQPSGKQDKQADDDKTTDQPTGQTAVSEGETPMPETSATTQPSGPQASSTIAHLPHGTHRASPYARGLARELGVDITALHPGNSGVITSREVLAAAMDGPHPNLNAGPPYRYKLLTTMHRAVAENMTATLHTPTFRVSAQLPVEPLQRFAHEHETSFTLLLARVAALTVVEHPRFNMAYTPIGLAVRDQVDVGIAVDVPGGLVTPVIRNAAGRKIDELSEDWRILRDKTRRQRLVPSDYEGATFYISNMGMFSAVHSFDAIVPLGATGILSIGAIQAGKAVMTLSCDHRVVFGADAARFMGSLEKHLSQPDL